VDWLNVPTKNVSVKSLPIIMHRYSSVQFPIMFYQEVLSSLTCGWAGYANVSTINNGVYDHQVYVHAQHFVDPFQGDIHTQTIEGLWMHAKRKLRFQSETSRDLFPSYLVEFQCCYIYEQSSTNGRGQDK